MTFEFKGFVKRSLFCLFILSVRNSWCFIEEEQVGISQKDDNETKNNLRKYCGETICSENQFCNIFKCECQYGFINRSNVCVLCAGKNEECLTSNDCCEGLLCAKGECGEAGFDPEFIQMFKVCLGIVVVSIIIVLLSYLLKWILTFESFHTLIRCRNSLSSDHIITQDRPTPESQPPPNAILEEKPPSYEECMLADGRRSLADSPPPYVISSSNFTTNKQNYFFSKTVPARSS